MKADIVFFDFDGTITRKDTFLEFIKFYRGSYKFYKGFLINSPFLIAYKLNLIPNYKAKQRILKYFSKMNPLIAFSGYAMILPHVTCQSLSGQVHFWRLKS